MKRVESIITKKLQDFFNGEVYVEYVCNILIVDVFFDDSSFFHKSVCLPQEIDITPELCDDLAEWVINDFIWNGMGSTI